MVGCDGEDSPSPIAPLLIWQQPHIIFMLELLYQSEPSEELVENIMELSEKPLILWQILQNGTVRKTYMSCGLR